jgi:cold shock protein
MQKGTVKWFNPTKGYGFIKPMAGDKDVFVHISAVERAGLSTLNENQVVEYDLVENRGKNSAETSRSRNFVTIRASHHDVVPPASTGGILFLNHVRRNQASAGAGAAVGFADIALQPNLSTRDQPQRVGVDAVLDAQDACG